MKTTTENRFIEEVKIAAAGNPNIDMKLVREWQEIDKILEKIPPPLTTPSVAKQPRLQPIPLRMFR